MKLRLLKVAFDNYAHKVEQKALAHLSFSKNELARAKELGIKSEKLLELKMLANETKRKTVSLSELEKKISRGCSTNYSPDLLKEISKKTAGSTTFGYTTQKLGNYAQTVVEKDGTMVKLLSNGLKVKIRPQADGSRIREVFDVRGKKVYDDVVKVTKQVSGNKTVYTKDVNSNFQPYSSCGQLNVNNYHRINERTYLSGELSLKKAKVNGGNFEHVSSISHGADGIGGYSFTTHTTKGKGSTTNTYMESYTGRKKKIVNNIDGNNYEYQQLKPNSEKYTIQKNSNKKFINKSYTTFSEEYNDKVPEYATLDYKVKHESIY